MGKEYVFKAIKDIEELARKEGLDFFPTIFEYVNKDIMLEACSYGLPVRARHWSYGRSYDHQKIYGEMGLSKVYEIVFNNDPAYAFLLNTNPDVINIMVAAHVYGHVHFFKHNYMFKGSDRSMIYRAAERAARVDQYIEQYGLEKVEHLMDIGFALDNHIDWHKGVVRKKYPSKRIVEEKVTRDEFDDLLNMGNNKRSIRYRTEGDKLPPHPERDLLWFLTNYAPLEEWERDVLAIIREESYYFYPIVTTKVINEGFACVLGDTLVYTSDGIVRMDELVAKSSSVVHDGCANQNVLHSGVFNDREVVKIHTKRGLLLAGADNHRVMGSDGNWHELKDLNIGDRVVLTGGNNLWPKNNIALDYNCKTKAKSLGQLLDTKDISYSTYIRHKSRTHATKQINVDKIEKVDLVMQNESGLGYTSVLGNRVPIKIPKYIDDDIGSLAGYLVGDGNTSYAARAACLTTGDESQADSFSDIVERLFGVKCSKRWDDTSKNGRWRVAAYSLHILDFLKENLGICQEIKAKEKSIPSKILRSPKSVVSAFIRAYADCDGCASEKSGVIFSTASDILAEQLQVVLLNYNILSSKVKTKKVDKVSKKVYWGWQIRITGLSAKTFYQEIGFGLERKQKKLFNYIHNRKFFKKESWDDTIVHIEHCGKQDVYDISVANTHRYAAAGFINHNSFWHAELMMKYPHIDEIEHMDFCKCHAGVVSPGSPFKINPYYLGFKIFTDIRERWDEKFKRGESDINGIQKIIKVAAEEDDASFLRNYLTKELAETLGLFNFGYRYEREPGMDEDNLTEEYGIIELKDRELDKIVENIIRPTVNYGAPLIRVAEVEGDTLVLEHSDDFGPLDEKYTEKTLSYIYELWGGPIEIKTYGDDKEPVVFIFDEAGFDIL